MKRIKASEFDEKFGDGEEVLQYCDLSTIRHPNKERVNANSAGRILLRDIWPRENAGDYKVHFARWNSKSQPLDEWVRDRSAWQGWQEYRPQRNEFNRTFIFSLMKFYHEEDTWLFGGIFRITARHKDRYEVKLTENGAPFIGRLKLHYSYRAMATRVNLENHYDNFEGAVSPATKALIYPLTSLNR